MLISTKSFRPNFSITPILAMFLFIVSVIIMTAKSDALTGSQFNAGNIIDDATFYSNSSMSISQIQSFLNAKVPTCDTNGNKPYYSTGLTRAQWASANGQPTPPYTCLKDYSQNIPTTINGGSDLCKQSIAGGTKTAANIIYDVAQACGVNPQVLIVLLQKEQSLVSDDWPWPVQYQKAAGYGCPDTAPCDSQYYGFFNQVYQAAKAFRRYEANPNSYNYKAYRNNYIYYHPSLGACGGTNVYIQNQATASLYIYTPYQPNAAALNNLYGTGDGCSAYGNRNFWRMFNDWFGSYAPPEAIKSANSSAVYLYIEGKKYGVPSMATLQDFGVNPQAIKTLSLLEFNAIQSPEESSGLNNSIGYLVKSPSDSDSDGGTVYLISIGRRYRIASYSQFLDFGFSDSSIRKLPLTFINSLNDGNYLSNFIASATTNNVFRVESNTKRIIFSGSYLNSINPSGAISRLSDGGLDLVESGDPLHNSEMFFRLPNGTVYFYNNVSNTYITVPNMDVFNCWGIPQNTNKIAYYSVARGSFVNRSSASIANLSCTIKNPNNNKSYVFVNGISYTVPTATGLEFTDSVDAKLTEAMLKITNKGDISRIIGSHNTNTLWYLEDGVRKPIPSMNNLYRLGYTGSNISYVSPVAEQSMPTSSEIKLGTGQIVKSSVNGTVYAISDDSRVAISSSSDFNDFGYSWNQLETYDESFLNTYYPALSDSINRFIMGSNGTDVYLVGAKRKYIVSDSLLSEFGVNKSDVLSLSYSTNIIFAADSGSMTRYIKSPDSATIFYIDSGQKRPFSSLASYHSHNTQNTAVSLISNDTIQRLPTGPNI